MNLENIANTESILLSTRKIVGLAEESDDFDTDIIVHINTVLAELNQLNVGPKTGFSIKDRSATWDDFIGGDTRLNPVKSYVPLRVKMMFDPPLSSVVSESINKAIDRLEWRILVAADEPVV